MRARILIPALIVAAGLSTAAFGQGAPRVVVGDNPSLSGAPLYVALEKGYYREAGIDVQLEMSGTSSDMEGRIIPQVILRLRGPGWGVGTKFCPNSQVVSQDVGVGGNHAQVANCSASHLTCLNFGV